MSAADSPREGSRPVDPPTRHPAISAIEVAFAVPVALTSDQERRLYELVNEIARANTPPACVHWLFGMGHKPNYSQADAAFLGKSIDPSAPKSGEPTFDPDVLFLETSCRERHGDE